MGKGDGGGRGRGDDGGKGRGWWREEVRGEGFKTGQPDYAGLQGLRQRVFFAESAQRRPRIGVWVGPDFKGGEGSACRGAQVRVSTGGRGYGQGRDRAQGQGHVLGVPGRNGTCLGDDCNEGLSFCYMYAGEFLYLQPLLPQIYK